MNEGFTNPLNTATPTMTVASILTWLELEVEYVEELKKVARNELQAMILTGIQVHLNEMYKQLADQTMQRLDEDTK